MHGIPPAHWVSAGSLLLFAIVGGLLLALRGEPAHPYSLPIDPERGLEPLRASSSPPPRTYVGVVVADQAVDVTARLEGQIQEIRVSPGDRVERGAILAVLDTEVLASGDLKIAEAERTAAWAETRRLEYELTHAQNRRTRTELLAGRHMVAAQDVEEALHLEQLAAARLVIAENAVVQKGAVVEQRRALVDHARVVAPISGIVSLRYVERGAAVTRGTSIVRIVDARTLQLRFAVPSGDAVHLRPGQLVKARVAELQVWLNATVQAIAPEVDAPSQMLLVYATVDAIEDAADLDQAIVGRAARVQVVDEYSAARNP